MSYDVSYVGCKPSKSSNLLHSSTKLRNIVKMDVAEVCDMLVTYLSKLRGLTETSFWHMGGV